jgi:hypothetical protein
VIDGISAAAADTDDLDHRILAVCIHELEHVISPHAFALHLVGYCLTAAGG